MENLAVRADRDESWYNVTCPICGKKFHLKQYKLKTVKHHYCSRPCLYEAKKTLFKGEGNHQWGLKGEKNASWKGGRRMSNYGYVLIQCMGHPFASKYSDYVFEHRIVAEKYLLTEENSVTIDGKKYLSPKYAVHHINGIRTDNRPENLAVMEKGKHSSIHGKIANAYRERDEKGRFKPGMPDEYMKTREGKGNDNRRG